MIPAPTITTSAVCVMVPTMIVRPRTSTDALGRPPPDASPERRASATRLGASHFDGWSVTMRVAELWRYPVKSLAGEQLDAVDILLDGLAEREWPGRRARIGEAIVAFEKLRGRCVMTTYDPDTLEHDPSVLRRIVQQMGGRLALDSYVVQAGRVSVGDSVKLL